MDAPKIKPTPKQEDFIFATQRFGCYSGAYGAGKTMAGCLRGLILSAMPNNFGLIGRNTYVELRDSTRKTFFEICPPEYFDEKEGGRWSPTENLLTLTNGSEIVFRHLDTIAEKELLSMNLGWFFIDQAEEISINVWRVLQSRLRLNAVPKRYGFVVCNPEPGTWIYDTFKRPHNENKLHKDYFYIEASSYDNPYLPREYIQTLIDSYPEELRKRYIQGRWDVFEGQIFKEFDPAIHVVRPFDIPKNWERIVSLDHGMVNPTGVLWGAIDFDNNIYIFDEYYSPGIVSEHAKAILEKTGDQEISLWVIDPSTQAKTREKENKVWSVMEEYEDYGLYFIPANNERLAGINRVREFMTVQDKRINPRTGEKKSPRLFIFQNCINLLWEIPQYQWKKLGAMVQKNKREQARDFNDHLCFCGHTQVLTSKGNKSIIDVKSGDKVWTPLGWSKVLRKEKTGFKEVITFRSTKATSNHPLMTQDGFRQLKDLKGTDRLWNAYISAGDHIDGIQILQDFPMQSIFAVAKRATQVKLVDYIRMSGFYSKGIFQKVFRSIIKIIITIEMILKILRWSVIPNILRNIWNLFGKGQKKEGLLDRRKQDYGIKVKMVNGYIENLVFLSGGASLYMKSAAILADLTTEPISQHDQGSAVSTAKCQCSDYEEVYNLVTDTGMYIANNVLVSNCDALRYMIMARFPAPLRKPYGNQMIMPIDRQNANLMSIPNQKIGDSELGSFYGPDGTMVSDNYGAE